MSNGARPQRHHGNEGSDLTPGGNPNTGKLREDLDVARSKLTDQAFDIKRYPDPLADRNGSDPQFFPEGVTLEMEKRWLAAIKAYDESAEGVSR